MSKRKRKPQTTPLLTGDFGVEQRKEKASLIECNGWRASFEDVDGLKRELKLVGTGDYLFLNGESLLSREHCAAIWPILKLFSETGKLQP